MNRKARLVLRILAAITIIEATLASYSIWSRLHTLSIERRALGNSNALFDRAVYAMFAANVVFIGLLIIVSVCLWMLLRRGLVLMIWTLSFEIAYWAGRLMVMIKSVSSLPERSPSPLFGTLERAAAYSNPLLDIQILTAYPIVAGILIFLAYHWLGTSPHVGSGALGRRHRASEPRKLTVLMRALSITNLSEAIAGLYFIGLIASGFLSARELSAGTLPYSVSTFYAMTLANLAFMIALLVSAAYLWRLKRKGLRLLAWTLSLEVIYVLGIAFGILQLSGENWSKPQLLNTRIAAATGIGNVGLSPQIITAYPLLAGAFIFIAYRYLSIPAKGSES